MSVWKRIVLFKRAIFRFDVNFLGGHLGPRLFCWCPLSIKLLVKPCQHHSQNSTKHLLDAAVRMKVPEKRKADPLRCEMLGFGGMTVKLQYHP